MPTPATTSAALAAVNRLAMARMARRAFLFRLADQMEARGNWGSRGIPGFLADHPELARESDRLAQAEAAACTLARSVVAAQMCRVPHSRALKGGRHA